MIVFLFRMLKDRRLCKGSILRIRWEGGMGLGVGYGERQKQEAVWVALMRIFMPLTTRLIYPWQQAPRF
jgi:hypothetical protein